MDGEYVGTVERVVDGRAVVVRLEDAGQENGTRERVEVPLELLPPGTHEAGSRLTVRLSRGEFVDASPYDENDEGGLLSRLLGR